MAVSKTTQLTDKLMKEIAKSETPLSALDYLIAMCANQIIDTDGQPWTERKRVLERAAEFCQARAAQCWTDEQIEAPITNAQQFDIPDDPDEDIL